MEGQVWAAVIGEVAGKAFAKVINTLGKRPSVAEKLQRLEMLVIKLRGTVEMSERVGPETESLLQWRDKLREAASKGHLVLVAFQRRRAAADEATEHQGGGRSAAVSLTRDALLGVARGVRSATAALLSCGERAVSFTRSTLMGMARGFRSATTVMLSCGEGVVELNSTVDSLEKTCADMGQFIRLLQVEVSQATEAHRPTTPTKRKRTPVKSARESIDKGGVAGNGKKDDKAKNREQRGDDEWARLHDALPLEDALPDELEVSSPAAQRLQVQNALAEISMAVAAAERSDLINVLEWLAPLADLLREVDRQQGRGTNCNAKAAKQQGDRRCSDVISKKIKQPGVNEKLQRLEMLVVKLRSTFEVCGRLVNETTSLLQWREKLREAASQGHLVLLSFQRRAMGAEAVTADATKGHRDRGKSGAVYFVKKALHGMERGDQSTITESLFDGEVGMKLKSTLDRLEEVCAHDVGDFIKLLQVLASGGNVMPPTTVERKKSAFQTALERAENMDISQNLILQDTSVSREEDGIRRRTSVVSSSQDCSRSRRRRRRLTCLPLSSSSSKQEEDRSRSRTRTRDFFSSPPSSKGMRCFTNRSGSSISSPPEDWAWRRSLWVGEEETSEDSDIERRARRRLTGLFSSSSSSWSTTSSSLAISSSEEDDDGGGEGQGLQAGVAVEAAMPWAVVRFQAALAAITRAEVMADGRDLEGLRWLADWANVLRDARQRGHAILVRIDSDSNDGKQSKGEEHEAHQLCTNAVHIVENLALDVECFISLVLLCPSI